MFGYGLPKKFLLIVCRSLLYTIGTAIRATERRRFIVPFLMRARKFLHLQSSFEWLFPFGCFPQFTIPFRLLFTWKIKELTANRDCHIVLCKKNWKTQKSYVLLLLLWLRQLSCFSFIELLEWGKRMNLKESKLEEKSSDKKKCLSKRRGKSNKLNSWLPTNSIRTVRFFSTFFYFHFVSLPNLLSFE